MDVGIEATCRVKNIYEVHDLDHRLLRGRAKTPLRLPRIYFVPHMTLV
jgi:hypothetical protein